MTTATSATVVGVFSNRQQAEQAVNELHRAGFRKNQIGVVARNLDGKETRLTPEDHGTHAEDGAVAGAVAGAGIGGLVGLGVLAGVLPVVGPALAAGTLATVLLNAAGGAAIGGLTGSLIGWGIPEEDAHFYEGELKAGRYLVTIQADERYDEAWGVLTRCGAYNRDTAGAVPTPPYLGM